MTWWTKIRGEVKKRDGREAKALAAFALTVARSTGIPMAELGLYRKDPVKHPDAVNELPALVARGLKGRRR
jgi:hypothetical protein